MKDDLKNCRIRSVVNHFSLFSLSATEASTFHLHRRRRRQIVEPLPTRRSRLLLSHDFSSKRQLVEFAQMTFKIESVQTAAVIQVSQDSSCLRPLGAAGIDVTYWQMDSAFFTTYSQTVLLYLQQMLLLGFSYHLMAWCDSNPHQQSCSGLGPLTDALPNEPQLCGKWTVPCVSPQVMHLQTFQPIPAGSIVLQILLAEVGLVWMGLISYPFLHVKVCLNNWLTSLISW